MSKEKNKNTDDASTKPPEAVPINTMEELKEFVKKYNDASKIMGEIFMTAYSKGARIRYGHYKSELEKVGLWDEYNTQLEIQDKLLAEHRVGRYWENFGDDGTNDIFNFLTTLLGMDEKEDSE